MDAIEAEYAPLRTLTVQQLKHVIKTEFPAKKIPSKMQKDDLIQWIVDPRRGEEW